MSKSQFLKTKIAEKRLETAFLKAYRADALAQQGGCCKFCLEPLSPTRVTADHRVPRSAGGTNHANNIAAACQDCNVAKASMTEKMFLSLLKDDSPAPIIVLLARFRRRLWSATHKSCGRLMRSVGGDYRGPRRKLAE